MAKNCLQLIGEFCGRTALTKPTTVFTSSDDGFIQLAALMNEGLDDLTTRHIWGVLQQETLHTTLAAVDQGDLGTICPYGFLEIVRNEIWDRTTNIKLNGPVSSSMWQSMQAAASGGPLYSWRVLNNHLHLYPAPPAGHTLAFEYSSNFAVTSIAPASTRKAYFEADTDLLLLPERLMYAWLRWRWKAEKGLPYQEEFRAYEILVAQAAAKDNEGATLDMGTIDNPGPGVFIPAGTWVPGL